MTVTPAVYHPLGALGTLDRVRSVIDLLPVYVDLATRIARTEFVPGPLRGREAAVLAALMYGAERGLGPMESLRSINVIDGRPAMSAEAMRALVLGAGHEIAVVDSTDQRAELRGRRAGSESWSPSFVWTIANARQAKLAGKDNWLKYPRAMLFARASTDLCRAIFPDVVAGLASVEEFDVIDVDSRELAAVVPGTAAATPYDDGPDDPAHGPDDDDDPDSEPGTHSLALSRRLHLMMSQTFPQVSNEVRDRWRHALVAITTRRRAGGPVVSSSLLTRTEQLDLSQRIVDLQTGRLTLIDDGDAWVELRHETGWTYLVELDPLRVDVRRTETSLGSDVETPEPASLTTPSTSEPDDPDPKEPA